MSFKGYKKVDLESYKIIETDYRTGKPQFASFPSDGIWVVSTKPGSRGSSRIITVEKNKELPELYPLVDLCLRKDDIATALMRFSEIKNKSLIELGECTYSTNELVDFLLQYLVSQELGGGSKKILVEKKWIRVEDEFGKNRFSNRF